MSDFRVDWAALLSEAVTKPGTISKAYFLFWNYSTGNQLLAMFQCHSRKIELGPIHTFVGWAELGRHVKKGEKAVTLCMPVTVKRPKPAEKDRDEPSDAVVTTLSATRFVYRPHWFVLSQTEGEDYVATETPQWSEALALKTLEIVRVPYRRTDGNCQGYASGREVAVSPLADLPHRTLFHELAHIVLGHTSEIVAGLSDGDERTPRDVREVEAECTALICAECLGLPGAEFSRGYIQHWMKKQTIEDKSVQKIFKAADAILRAGRSTTDPSPSTWGIASRSSHAAIEQSGPATRPISTTTSG